MKRKKRKKKLSPNPTHPVADGPDGSFRGCVVVWYEDSKTGKRELDYVIGGFRTDIGAYEWAERNRAKGRTCTIELLMPPLDEELRVMNYMKPEDEEPGGGE